MADKSLLFVVCTMLSAADFALKSETYKFFQDNSLVPNDDYVVFYGNKSGLPSIYNKFLTPEYAGKIVVFIHDDVKLGYHIKTLQRELNTAHTRFDIVGLAGATRMNLANPTLWHIMATGRSGAVGHCNAELSQMSNYGPTPAQCIMVDGVFMSVNVERANNAEHKFDEQFNFHHYDLDFCIQANDKKLTISTWPIWVTHLSPGLSSLEKNDWKKSNELFCKKYNII